MSTVRVLSLKQPWASLVVRGVKRFESREWPPGWRGRIAIHACACVVSESQWNTIMSDPAVHSAASSVGVRTYADALQLPRSAVVGSARVDDVRVLADWGDAEINEVDMTLSSWWSSDILWRFSDPEECESLGPIEAMPKLWYLEGDPVEVLKRGPHVQHIWSGTQWDDREAVEDRAVWMRMYEEAEEFVQREAQVPYALHGVLGDEEMTLHEAIGRFVYQIAGNDTFQPPLDTCDDVTLRGPIAALVFPGQRRMSIYSLLIDFASQLTAQPVPRSLWMKFLDRPYSAGDT